MKPDPFHPVPASAQSPRAGSHARRGIAPVSRRAFDLFLAVSCSHRALIIGGALWK